MKHEIPENLEQAVKILSQGDWTVVAGGTDFYPALGDKTPPQNILDLGAVKELRHSSQAADGWQFGATTTWSDIARAQLPAAFFGLQQAAREVGSLQIQNSGTLAGNLCNASPAADGVPPLLTLDAKVTLTSSRGDRILPLADFITGVRKTELAKDEIVKSIFIPTLPANAKGAFNKLGSRRYLVISICMVAAVIVPGEDGKIKQANVAVGACSPVALRLTKLEQDLVGAALDPQAIRQIVGEHHLDCLSPIADVRGSAEFRKDAVLELVQRTLIEAL